MIQEGFEVCRQLLDLTAKDGDASSFAENVNELLPVHKKLCEINQKCSMEIYSSNRAALRHKGKINWYCRFVLVFQIINYLTITRNRKEIWHAQKKFMRNFILSF